jgi:hypothetical protein
MSDDRGAAALDREHAKWCENIAVATVILGEHGVFLPEGLPPEAAAMAYIASVTTSPNAELETEVERLRAALSRYGHHDRDCQLATREPCFCGLNAAALEGTDR